MFIINIYNTAMKYSSALPGSYTQKLFESWQEVINRNEICSIVTPPVFANDYRISNFLDWQKEHKHQECKYVNLHVYLIYDPEDVKKIFINTDKPLIIASGSHLLEKNSFAILSAFIYYKVKYNRSILIFFESTLLEIKNLPTEASHNLLQNVSYIPLFSFQNTKHFSMHIAQRWSINLTEAQIKEIYEYTGGHVWLVKEALRQLAKKEELLSKIFSSQEMNYKKSKIWDQLNKDHKNYLVKLTQDFSKEIKDGNLVLNDLTNLGFIKKEKPYVPEFISELASNIQHNIEVKDSEIFFNDVNVTSLFSKKEQRIFLGFYYAVDNKLSREKLADIIWNEEDKSEYSDWALDKAISRLRSKFKKLGVAGKTLITLRDHGYQLMIK